MTSPVDPLRPAPPSALRRHWACSPATEMRIVLFAAFALFLIYGSFRQRYIWGVDSFGYYQLGKLFSEGRTHLPLPFVTEHAGPLSPWGFTLGRGETEAHPDYPPGFPLLLAVGHVLGAPRWVTPFVGALSCVLLFQLLRARATFATAAILTAAWAVLPIVVYGATALMSDLLAATSLMAALLAFQRGRLAVAAWAVVFACAVRPSNAILAPPFLLLLRRDRTTVRFVLHLLAPSALYGLYNLSLYGAPWQTGYGNIWGQMSVNVFPAFFGFFVSITWTLLTPILLGFAAAAFVRPTRERLFLLLWPLTLTLFYSFWSAGGTDKWWWARFILPGYPGLFLLAADGAEATKQWAAARSGWPRWSATIVTLLLALVPLAYLKFGRAQNDLWLRTIGTPNYELVQRVAAIVPAGSLVGTLEHASTMKLYTPLVPFVCVQRGAAELVGEALAQRRRVFYLPEPWLRDDPVVTKTMQRYAAREVARFDSPWRDLVLYELTTR